MKRLSSPFTLFFKFVLPCAWLGLGAFALTRVFAELSGIALIAPVLLVCVWLGTGMAIFYWNNFPLKRVFLDGQLLYVSNYLKRTSISLHLIDNVRATGGGSWWRWPPYRVIVTLKATSEFGNEIKFIPGAYYQDVVSLLMQKLEANRAPEFPSNLRGNISRLRFGRYSFRFITTVYRSRGQIPRDHRLLKRRSVLKIKIQITNPPLKMNR